MHIAPRFLVHHHPAAASAAVRETQAPGPEIERAIAEALPETAISGSRY